MKNFILILTLIITWQLSATIINVPYDQATIQEGIDISADGDTVLVQLIGTYVENINFSGKDITVSSLYLTTQDTSYISQTIIDGNQTGSVVTFESGEDNTAVLCGFTITNGYYNNGGGIKCINSDPIIEDVIITNNSSGEGGGLHFESSMAMLRNMIISENSATAGGGIFCLNANISLENISIVNNSSSWNGGGIYTHDSNPSLTNVTFSNNSALEDGGGMCFYEHSYPNLTDVIVNSNTASAKGGGLYFESHSDAFLSGVTISNNTADYGGGIYCCDYSNMNIADTDIINNSADINGGGIYSHYCIVILNNIKIKNNIANQGGGILSKVSNTSLENVSITNNFAYSDGAGIYLENVNNFLTFSTENRSSIYSNNTSNSRVLGQDIYKCSQNFITVVVDTFTVVHPTEYYAYPIDDFSFDILNQTQVELINADLFVSVDGENSNSGLSEDDPFRTIQHALSRIYSHANDPRTIFVSEGVYSPQTNGESFPLDILDNVSIQGSSEEGTIIDADSSDTVFKFRDADNTRLENLTIKNGFAEEGGGIAYDNSDSYLTNITLSDNFATDKGGGIYVDHSDLIMENVTVSNNISVEEGGGVSFEFSNSTLRDVNIFNNSSNDGGGLYCHGSVLSLESSTITTNNALIRGGGIFITEFSNNVYFNTEDRCNIYSNECSSRIIGKDIYCGPLDNVIDIILDTFTVLNPSEYYIYPLENFTFDILNAIQDSLINADLYVSPTGDNSNSGLNEFEPFLTIQHALSRIYVDSQNHNSIKLASGLYSPQSTEEIFPLEIFSYLTITGVPGETILDAESLSRVIKFDNSTNCNLKNLEIRNGSASSYGGGIECWFSSPIIENVKVANNYTSSDGGGMFLYGSNPTLINVSVINNHAAGNGGGIRFWQADANINNLLVADNLASGSGGGIYTSSSDIIFSSSHIIDNSASGTGGGIYCSAYTETTLINSISWNNLPQEIYSGFASDVIVSYSDIQNGIDGISIDDEDLSWLEGNIDSDPLFVGTGTHPFALSENSPCIDAGTLELPEGIVLPAFDLAGNPRICGGSVDMGAYEWQDIAAPIHVAVDSLSGTLTWQTPPNNFPSGYNIYLDEDYIQTLTNDINEYTFLQLMVNQQYSAGVSAIYNGEETPIIRREFTYIPVSINNEELIINNYELKNYPNPFNPETTISFALAEDARTVEVKVYNIKGQLVKTLMDAQVSPGEFNIIWQGADNHNKRIASGTYFVKLNVNGEEKSVKKVTVVK